MGRRYTHFENKYQVIDREDVIGLDANKETHGWVVYIVDSSKPGKLRQNIGGIGHKVLIEPNHKRSLARTATFILPVTQNLIKQELVT
jgi:hypothetical protein